MKHHCPDWYYLLIDETYVEFECCNCYNTEMEPEVEKGGIIMDQSIKKDKGKPRCDLVPPEWTLAMAEVLTFGVEKGYREESWREVEVKRYIASTLRHFYAFQLGEDRDPESGLPHLAHALTNIGFLLTLTKKTKE